MPAPLMTAPTRGALTALTAALIALATFGGSDVMAALVLVVSFLFAWGFPLLLRASAARGVSLVLALTALAAVTVEVQAPDLNLLPVVLAFGVVGAFLQQMFRQDGRPELVESVSAAVAGIIIIVSGAGWIGALTHTEGTAAALITAAALALGAGCMYIPGPSAIAATASCVLPTTLGAILGEVLPGVEALPMAFLGLAAGVMVASTHILFLRFRSLPGPAVGIAAAVLAPLALGLPVAQLSAFFG